jgi:hypothetical protein
MSFRQIEWQLKVLRFGIGRSALATKRAFGSVLAEKLYEYKHGAAADAGISPEDLQEVLHNCAPEYLQNVMRKIRVDQPTYVAFADKMSKRAANLPDLIGRAVTASTRLFHHAEISAGRRQGRVKQPGDLWSETFDELTRLVFIFPHLYCKPRTPLPEALECIATVYDVYLNRHIPMDLEQLPSRDVLPMSTANLREHTARGASVAPPTPQRRHAPSVVSLASTVTMVPKPNNVDDEDVQSLLSMRRERQVDERTVDMGGRLRIRFPK